MSTSTDPIDSRWTKARVIEPTNHGYVYVACTSGPWRFPLAVQNRRSRRQLRRLREIARDLRADQAVLRADVFRGFLRPPGTGEAFPGQVSPAPQYDSVLLVETATVARAREILESTRVSTLVAGTPGSHAFAASNVRNLGQVDHSRQGVFLFNYFVADSVEANLDAWQYTAGWFQAETGLDNSTVLRPLETAMSHHTLVNHCRWDHVRDTLPSLMFKRSFHTFVLRHFHSRRVVPRPLFYRLVRPLGELRGHFWLTRPRPAHHQPNPPLPEVHEPRQDHRRAPSSATHVRPSRSVPAEHTAPVASQDHGHVLILYRRARNEHARVHSGYEEGSDPGCFPRSEP